MTIIPPVMVVCVISGIRTWHPGIQVRSVTTGVKFYSPSVLCQLGEEPSVSVDPEDFHHGLNNVQQIKRSPSVWLL
jgi:hypothetical protein